MVFPRWDVVALGVGLGLLATKRVSLGLMGVCGVALAVWGAISLWWAPSMAAGADSLVKLAICLGLFVLGRGLADIRGLYVGAALGLVPSVAVALLQQMGFQPFYVVSTTPSGLFFSPNALGEASTLVLVGLGTEGLWGLAALVLPALVLSLARGAMLAVAVVGALSAKRSVVVPMLAFVLVASVMPSKVTYGFTATMQERVDIWRETANRLTWLGHGLGSYGEEMRDVVPGKVLEHAHNDGLELAYELGLPGVLAVLAALGWLVLRTSSASLYVLVALACEALVGFPLHTVGTLFLGSVVAGWGSRAGARVRGAWPAGGEGLRGRGQGAYARGQVEGFGLGRKDGAVGAEVR